MVDPEMKIFSVIGVRWIPDKNEENSAEFICGWKSKMKTKIVFLPGLGADSRLFLYQRKAFKNVLTPPWLIPKSTETLTHYAKRWARELKLNRDYCLVGVSFGGMVAQEMARWVRPKAVLLVGSCRSARSVPFYLRLAGSSPGWPRLSKALCKFFPVISGSFLGARTAAQRDLLIRMFLETPNDFAKWTVKAIRTWEGCDTGGTKILHIHGKNDHLIPIRGVQADRVIRDGGHLINLTHPKEVNEFIKECLR